MLALRMLKILKGDSGSSEMSGKNDSSLGHFTT